MIKKYAHQILPLAFLFTLAATATSLALSLVLDIIPCQLCWYQRILMFPIPVILGVALLRRDYRAYLYALPFTVAGIVVSFYQSLLQWGVVGESQFTCDGTVSCADTNIELFGFITIPFLTFLTFGGLTLLMVLQAKYGRPIKNDFKQQLELLLRLVAIVLVAFVIFLVIKKVS